MGKIFKALEKSQNGFEAEDEVEVVPGKGKNTSAKIDYAIKKTVSKKENTQKNLITVHDPDSVESEQFRLLKNAIFFPESGKPAKTIMVTSAGLGEGKSFTASNLAITIARSLDNHVLLIDADLRRPSVHSVFGFENSAGLSDYLSENIPLASLLVKTFMEKLTILPGGPPPDNPSELVSSENMERLIEEVKSRYADRYTIIDSPPPYMTSEGNALAKFAEGIIVVVKDGKTSKENLKDIIDIYGREKIIGVVRNFSKGKFGAGYGYKNKYFYGKGA